jgi:bifunctional hydroxylase/dehydrase
MVAGLDIRYDVGPGDHPLLGRRMPNRELVGNVGESGKTTTIEQLNAARPVVFDLAEDPRTRAATSPWSDRVDVVTATPLAGAWTSLEGADAVLVRPDGYVAWVSAGGSGPEGLPDALTRWFGPAQKPQ